MSKLEFDARAKKEFDRLDRKIKRQLQKKLAERLIEPRIQADRLAHMPNCYKIKLRSAGYRLIYRVEDDVVVVFVIAIGQRDSRKNDVYDMASRRLKKL